MSQPKFPPRDPSLTREEAINQILSSIAMEELGLSHIINTEGEKIQYALGTIDGVTGPEQPVTIDNLLELNRSVRDTLDGTMQNQLLLKAKLQAALSASTMRGPTGAPGPMTTILDSYETYERLVEEHPTGKPGDAYLVAGSLYVWNPETKQWENAGSLIGPMGPIGPAGPIGTILDSLESKDKLPDPGNPGDAYLVQGELFVWDTLGGEWKSVGKLIGPAGPSGPTGATGLVGTILESYPTYQEFIDKHPEGLQGDAYLAEGTLYVWDTVNKAWKAMGSLIGPSGPQGPAGSLGPKGDDGPQGQQGLSGTGGIIQGIAPTKQDLDLITGNEGDLYLVGAAPSYMLYFWKKDTGWTEIGPFVSTQGPTGPQGPFILGKQTACKNAVCLNRFRMGIDFDIFAYPA